jgi:hypothetical protein
MALFHSPSIVTSGLVLCLDAGNPKSYPGSGTTWTDLSGNGNNGTLTNGPTYSSTNGGSLSFDGTDDYVSIPYTSTLAPTSQITFSAWAFLSDWNISGDRRILSKTQSGGYQIGLNEPTFMTDGFLGALVYAGGAYRIVKVSRSTISSGWHNLSFTFDGRYFIMYIDGSNVNTYDHGSNITISYSTNNHFLVGAEPGAGTAVDGAYWNGSISQVQVYNRALSAAEIQQNFNALRGRFGI